MEREEPLTNPQNRHRIASRGGLSKIHAFKFQLALLEKGVRSRRWLPHIFDVAKGFLAPAFQTMPNLPITIPWKALQRVGIPSMGTQRPTAAEVLGPSTSADHALGTPVERVKEYGLRRAVSAQLPPNSETNRIGRPGNDLGTPLKQLSSELPSTADHRPVHQRGNLPRPTTVHQQSILDISGAVASSYPEGATVDGLPKCANTSENVDSGGEILEAPDSIVRRDDRTPVEIMESSLQEAHTSVLSTDIPATITLSVGTQWEAEVAHTSDENSTDMPQQTTDVSIQGVITDTTSAKTQCATEVTDASVQGVITDITSTKTQCAAETIDASVQGVTTDTTSAKTQCTAETNDASAQGVITDTTSAETQCAAETIDASVQGVTTDTTSAKTQCTTETNDASVQGVITDTTSIKTQCAADTVDACIQATYQFSTQTVATQVLTVEKVDVGVQREQPTFESTTQTNHSATATIGTQSCGLSSADVGTQIASEIQSTNAATQVNAATCTTSTQADAGPEDVEAEPEDDNQLADRIARMVKAYAARQMLQTDVHSDPTGFDRISPEEEEEVHSFLSRMRGIMDHTPGSSSSDLGHGRSFTQSNSDKSQYLTADESRESSLESNTSIDATNNLKRLNEVALVLDVQPSTPEEPYPDHSIIQMAIGSPASPTMEDMNRFNSRLQDVALVLDFQSPTFGETSLDSMYQFDTQTHNASPVTSGMEDANAINGLQEVDLVLDFESPTSEKITPDIELHFNTQTRDASLASPAMEDMDIPRDFEVTHASSFIEGTDTLERLEDVLALDVQPSLSEKTSPDLKPHVNIQARNGAPASPPMEDKNILKGLEMADASLSMEDMDIIKRIQEVASTLDFQSSTCGETFSDLDHQFNIKARNVSPVCQPMGDINIFARLQDVALSLDVQQSTSSEISPDPKHRLNIQTRTVSPVSPPRDYMNNAKGVQMTPASMSIEDTNIFKRLQDVALTLDFHSSTSDEISTDLEHHFNTQTRSVSPTCQPRGDINILGRLQDVALALNNQPSKSEEASPDAKYHINTKTRDMSPAFLSMDNNITIGFEMVQSSSSIEDTDTLKRLQDVALVLDAQPTTSKEIALDLEHHFNIQTRNRPPVFPHLEEMNILKDLENVALALGDQPSTRREQDSFNEERAKRTFSLSPQPYISQISHGGACDKTTTTSERGRHKPKMVPIPRGTFDLAPAPDRNGTSIKSKEALETTETRLDSYRGTFDCELEAAKAKIFPKSRGTFDVPHVPDHSEISTKTTGSVRAGSTQVTSHRGTFDFKLQAGEPKTFPKNRGTFDLSDVPDSSGISNKKKGSLRAAATRLASRRGTFSPMSVHELNEIDGAKANTTVQTYEDDQGWIVPDVDVPIVDEDCVDWKLQADGVTHTILGTGSFGSVEAASYRQTDGTTVAVAVKIYNTERSDFETIIREAKMLQYTQDTGVFPRFYGYMDIGVGDGTNLCLVQECFGNGTTLAEFVDDTRNVYHLAPIEWLSICIQLAKGLSKIHDKNIRFNDLKENNILVDDSVKGRPVIRFIDVGISTYTHGVVFTYTEEELRKYSDSFPPELKDGNATTVLSDIYSLGQIYLAVDEKTKIPGLLNVAQSCVRPFPQHRVALGGVITCLISITRINKMV